MTTAEAAAILKCCRRTVNRAIADGQLTACDKMPGRTGGYLIALAEVRRFKREREIAPSRATHPPRHTRAAS